MHWYDILILFNENSLGKLTCLNDQTQGQKYLLQCVIFSFLEITLTQEEGEGGRERSLYS